MTDWQKIGAEYITGDINLRTLAHKYGVTEGCLYARSRKEDWAGKKRAFRARAAEKIIDAVSEGEARRAADVARVADKLLRKVEAQVDAEEHLPAATLKTLSEVLKNIKAAQMIRTPEDIAEQQAKIAKLRNDKRQDEMETAITVTLEGGLEDYAM